MNVYDKLPKDLVVALFFSLTTLFFGPVDLYFNNINEFSNQLFDFWYYVVGITFFILFFLLIFLRLFRNYSKQFAVLFFAISFLIWLQGNIFVWNYGVLNGKEINWNDYNVYAFLEVVVWLGFLFFVFFKRNFVYRLINKGSIFLIVMQVITLCVAWFNVPINNDTNQIIAFDDSDKFNFSSDKNVVILVLDTFQSDLFSDIVLGNDSYKNVFDGFIYYPNAVGGFPTTYPSIPLLLTGKYYNNNVPIQDFIKDSYLSSSSIPYQLLNNGYDVDLYPQVNYTVYPSNKVASNWISVKGHKTNKIKDLEIMYKVSFFRYMPHVFKRFYYENVINDLMAEDNLNDLTFVNDLQKKFNVSSNNKMFKFIHLRGAHPPFHINSQLEEEKLEYSYKGYKEQAEAELKIVGILIKKLKEFGVYDNTMMLVLGDHGLGSFDVRNKFFGNLENDRVVKPVSSKLVSFGIPLILAKPFASSGLMKISKAPVSLSDIPITIFKELNMSTNIEGISLFDENTISPRERKFYMYNWKNDDWSKEYLPPMNEYTVSGFSWLSSSWTPTYRELSNNGVKSIAPPLYKYNTQISFCVGGNSGYYKGAGWSEPEESFTWTDGKNASLIIPIENHNKDLILRASLIPFTIDKIDKQKVDIYVNGESVGQWNVCKPGQYDIVLPKEYVTGSQLKIVFRVSDPASPFSQGISNDKRDLGIAFKSIEISTK